MRHFFREWRPDGSSPQRGFPLPFFGVVQKPAKGLLSFGCPFVVYQCMSSRARAWRSRLFCAVHVPRSGRVPLAQGAAAGAQPVAPPRQPYLGDGLLLLLLLLAVAGTVVAVTGGVVLVEAVLDGVYGGHPSLGGRGRRGRGRRRVAPSPLGRLGEWLRGCRGRRRRRRPRWELSRHAPEQAIQHVDRDDVAGGTGCGGCRRWCVRSSFLFLWCVYIFLCYRSVWCGGRRKRWRGKWEV